MEVRQRSVPETLNGVLQVPTPSAVEEVEVLLSPKVVEEAKLEGAVVWSKYVTGEAGMVKTDKKEEGVTEDLVVEKKEPTCVPWSKYV